MAGKIFVNYRRDDARDIAARIRDRLAQSFGDANVFMDVDNLLAGQRFDKELEKALSQTDVFLAVIGPRWTELLAERQGSGGRDYVREEIAGALQRGIVVIPVLIERTPLPRADLLPVDISDLVLHQTHEVVHARFGRDVADLIDAIRVARKAARAEAGTSGSAVRWIGAVALVSLLLGGGVLAYLGLAPDRGAGAKRQENPLKADTDKARQEDAQAKQAAKEATERQRLAMLKAEEDHAEEARKRAEGDLSRPGRVFRDCSACPEMVVVPAGSFMMGSPPREDTSVVRDQGPQRWVTIAKPFAVGKFEVTFAEWDACLTDGGCRHRPSDEDWGRGKQPAINVSWDDITREYLPWLSRKSEKTYRLPTEAEWEYAARADSTTRYHFGNDVSNLCTYGNVADQTLKENDTRVAWTNAVSCRDGYIKTAPVGAFQPNAFGLHDMHGNVWEWVQDCYKYKDSYVGAPIDGSPVRDVASCPRAKRGGSWTDAPSVVSAAHRFYNPPHYRNNFSGFRVARTLVR